MTAWSEDVGKYAILRSVQGTPHASGRIIAYSEQPTVTVETADGERIHWRADLATVVDGTTITDACYVFPHEVMGIPGTLVLDKNGLRWEANRAP